MGNHHGQRNGFRVSKVLEHSRVFPREVEPLAQELLVGIARYLGDPREFTVVDRLSFRIHVVVLSDLGSPVHAFLVSPLNHRHTQPAPLY